MKDATIDDVASEAGVSIKTVSRVLNREPNVRGKTRKLVEDAVDRLNYRPSLFARSLAGAKSRLIALIYDNPNTGYIANLQFGAIERCRGAGYHLMAEPVDLGTIRSTADLAGIVGTVRIDGAILAPPVSDSAIVMAMLDSMQIPYVRIAPLESRERAPRVEMNDVKAAYEMTSHLISLGHTKISFIEGPASHGASHRRKEGFLAAMQDHRVKVSQSWILKGDFTFRSGFTCAESLFKLSKQPTALFASNDDMALGVLSYAHRLGLMVPADLSIAGFDDTAAAGAVWPQLTTVRQPMAELAAVAAELIISGKATSRARSAESHVLGHHLVVRESTAPPGSMCKKEAR